MNQIMRMDDKKSWGKSLLLLCLALQPALAFAYIDPNAAGLLFQLLAPFFAMCVGAWIFMRKAIATAIRAAWRKLTDTDNRS